jgi:transposase
MLNASAAKIYLCLDPTDMRKSFDTLAALVRAHLQGDPQSGIWFVFRGKQGNRLKILYWDDDGYALWQKRLERGTFEFPKVIGAAAGVAISATELSLILGGVALSAKRRPRYTKPAESAEKTEISSHL